LLGTYSVGGQPFGLAFDGANMWVGNAVGSAIVTKLRASDGTVLGTFPVNSVGYGVAFDGTYIWTSNTLRTVTRLKLDGTNAGVFTVGGDPWGIAFDGTNIWVGNTATSGGTVEKLRASDGALLGTSVIGGGVGYGIVFDGIYVWVTNFNNLVQLRVSDAKVLRTFPTPRGSSGLAFDGANLWVAEYDGNYISKM
jgi:DNA-binding beta-propeller fold protein YncE